MVFRSLIKDVPIFNQGVHSSPKGDKQIGKVDEILGPVGKFYFTVTPFEGVAPDSFAKGAKIYIDKAFLLPLIIFTNPIKPSGPKRVGGGFSKNPGFSRQGGSNGTRPQGNFGNRPQGNFGNRPQGNFGNRPQGNYNNRQQ